MLSLSARSAFLAELRQRTISCARQPGRPSEIARRIRLQEVVRRFSIPGAHIATVAADLPHTDQAHVTNEFHSVTGVTPGRYLRDLGRSQSDLSEYGRLWPRHSQSPLSFRPTTTSSSCTAPWAGNRISRTKKVCSVRSLHRSACSLRVLTGARSSDSLERPPTDTPARTSRTPWSGRSLSAAESVARCSTNCLSAPNTFVR